MIDEPVSLLLINLKEVGMMKKTIFVMVFVALAFFFWLVVYNREVPFHGEWMVEEIQEDPNAFLGDIVLTGIVGDSETRDFSLQNESGTFEVLVDFRGSQALPELGTQVVIEGRLTENRPCCGPGFTIRTTRFDPVEG